MSSGKALTNGEWKDTITMVLEGVPASDQMNPDAIRAHLKAKGMSHQALELMLGMEPQQAVKLLSAQSEIEKSMVVTAPAGLLTILENQVDRMLDIGAFGEAKVSRGKYKDELMTVVKAFVWRPELAAIGLTELALIDYRLSGKFLAEAGNVYCYIEPDKCKNFRGVVTPDGVQVIQAQWGEKYRNKKPVWCRSNFHSLEQGSVVKEGLTAYLYGGKKLLKKCYMDLPGSVSGGGIVPCLDWFDDGPKLRDDYDDDAGPGYGSVSRGK